MKKILLGCLMIASMIVKGQHQTPPKPNLPEGEAKGQYIAQELERPPLNNSLASGQYKGETLNRSGNVIGSREPIKEMTQTSKESTISNGNNNRSGGNFEIPTSIPQNKTTPIKTQQSGGLDKVEHSSPQIITDSKENYVPLNSKTSGGF